MYSILESSSLKNLSPNGINNKPWTKEEEIDQNKRASISSNDIMKLNYKHDHMVRVLMWNPRGRGVHADKRDKVNQTILENFTFDIVLIQEPLNKIELNYQRKFNTENSRGKYRFTYPQMKGKSKMEVAIAYDTNKLVLDKTEDQYDLIAEGNKQKLFEGKFWNFGPSRVQLSYFSVLGSDDDGSEYKEHRNTTKNSDFLVINFHSIYNNSSKKEKFNFITDFFKFVDWYLKLKQVNIPVLIGGDFNFDIRDEVVGDKNLIENLSSVYDIQLVIPNIPNMEDYFDVYEQDIRPTSNIDYLLTLKSNYVEIHEIQKFPARSKYFEEQFKELLGDYNSNIFDISTHDPIICNLLLYFNKFDDNNNFESIIELTSLEIISNLKLNSNLEITSNIELTLPIKQTNKKGTWDLEETKKVYKGHQLYGNNWKRVEKEFFSDGSRTNKQICDKWRSLKKIDVNELKRLYSN